MSSAVGCLREVVVYTRGQSTGGSYDGWLFCIWGNTSGSSIFTTSVETIFSFRSWEIRPIVYKAVAYGTLKTFENYKQASSMRRGRLREVVIKGGPTVVIHDFSRMFLHFVCVCVFVCIFKLFTVTFLWLISVIEVPSVMRASLVTFSILN